LAAVLAVIAIPLVVTDARPARLAVWIFNIEGTVDLMLATTLATVHEAHMQMGPAYWIPAFWVPALLVTHYITFVVLLRFWRSARYRRGLDQSRRTLVLRDPGGQLSEQGR
jgi:hypothetical protein